MTFTAWPADQVERWPLFRLQNAAKNARTHTAHQIAQIAASVEHWGWTAPVLVDESGVIIAGHGRVLAAESLNLKEIPVMIARGWSEQQRRAYALADNQLALNAAWDPAVLADELADLQVEGFDLELIGFDPSELADLVVVGGESAVEDEEKGSLLARADVTIEDPRTEVSRGERWRLGRHTLMVCSVVEDWPQWAPLLQADTLYCPFPGPFIFASLRAKDRPLLMVQPDAYIAGHIVDRYVELFGDDDVTKVDAT